MIFDENIKKNRFTLGYVDPRPDSDYIPEQLEEGTEEEKEHCSYSKIAKIIAKDHLDQNPHYYTTLEYIEKKYKKPNPDRLTPEELTISRLNNPHLDKRPDEKYNKLELRKGINVEMEHTDDPLTAKMIAKDHLDEMPNYYELLEKYELIEKTDPSEIKLQPDDIYNRINIEGVPYGYLSHSTVNTKQVQEEVTERYKGQPDIVNENGFFL